MTTRWDKRFFSSTRGRVASLLRFGNRTVDELAGELELTDNAVRAHLASLERDGLVSQGDSRRGSGKPSFTYRLTPEAERLFPKEYGVVLQQLLSALPNYMSSAEMTTVFQDVGHRMAAGHRQFAGEQPERVARALQLLAELGGAATSEQTEQGFLISGCDCPIAAAVSESPDACVIAETILGDLIGSPVIRRCESGPPPHCRFEVLNKDAMRQDC